MSEPETNTQLQVESARLIALLEARGIEWRLPPEGQADPKGPTVEQLQLTPDQKVALFRRLRIGNIKGLVLWRNGRRGTCIDSPGDPRQVNSGGSACGFARYRRGVTVKVAVGGPRVELRASGALPKAELA